MNWLAIISLLLTDIAALAMVWSIFTKKTIPEMFKNWRTNPKIKPTISRNTPLKLKIATFSGLAVIVISSGILGAIFLPHLGIGSIIVNTITTTRVVPSPSPTPTDTTVLTPQEQLFITVTSGNANWFDPLSHQDANDWDVSDGCKFTGGQYHVIATQQGQVETCFAKNIPLLTDFAFQVEMTVINGNSGGLVFHATSPTQSSIMYRTPVDIHGYYNFYLGQNEKCNDLPSSDHLYCSSPSNAKAIGLSKIITVIVQGKSVMLYINGIYVDTASSVISPSGYIGVFANFYQVYTEVAFSKLKIWTSS